MLPGVQFVRRVTYRMQVYLQTMCEQSEITDGSCAQQVRVRKRTVRFHGTVLVTKESPGVLDQDSMDLLFRNPSFFESRNNVFEYVPPIPIGDERKSYLRHL